MGELPETSRDAAAPTAAPVRAPNRLLPLLIVLLFLALAVIIALVRLLYERRGAGPAAEQPTSKAEAPVLPDFKEVPVTSAEFPLFRYQGPARTTLHEQATVSYALPYRCTITEVYRSRGDWVEPGTALLAYQSPELLDLQSGYAARKVTLRQAAAELERCVKEKSAVLAVYGGLLGETDSSRLDGAVKSVPAVLEIKGLAEYRDPLLGALVERGKRLRKFETNRRLGGSGAVAREEVDNARDELLRANQKLLGALETARSEVLAREHAAQTGYAKVRTEFERDTKMLKLYGSSLDSIDGKATLRASRAGLITELGVSPGSRIPAEQQLVKLVDTSRLRFEVQIPEKAMPFGYTLDARTVRAEIRAPLHRAVEVNLLSPERSPTTRTLLAVGTIQNHPDHLGRRFLANSAIELRIESIAAESRTVLPAQCLLDGEGDERTVIVVRGIAEKEFTAVKVKVIPHPDDLALVLLVSATPLLRPGDRLVTEGKETVAPRAGKDGR